MLFIYHPFVCFPSSTDVLAMTATNAGEVKGYGFATATPSSFTSSQNTPGFMDTEPTSILTETSAQTSVGTGNSYNHVPQRGNDGSLVQAEATTATQRHTAGESTKPEKSSSKATQDPIRSNVSCFGLSLPIDVKKEYYSKEGLRCRPVFKADTYLRPVVPG